jgi:hypothetical protein
MLVLALAAVLASLLFATPTLAQGPGFPTRLQLRAEHMLGVVPALGSPMAAEPLNAFGNLDYHGGTVMRTNKVYAIYWIPSTFSVSANYKSVINGYFSNVHTANGKKTNVYYSDTQYFDTTGGIKNTSTFGGSATDTNAFPASGCSDPFTTFCLTDAQIQTELKNVIAAHGWKVGPKTMFFMFTPKNVGSCLGTACAYSFYCGYHSFTTNSSNKVILYANMPYAAWVNCAVPSQPQPNGDDADYTINIASHEHNETITDEQGTAWWDSNTGEEDGDKCDFIFGTAIGSTSHGQYNQAIGTGKYYIQQEWSNHSTACVLKGH